MISSVEAEYVALSADTHDIVWPAYAGSSEIWDALKLLQLSSWAIAMALYSFQNIQPTTVENTSAYIIITLVTRTLRSSSTNNPPSLDFHTLNDCQPPHQTYGRHFSVNFYFWCWITKIFRMMFSSRGCVGCVRGWSWGQLLSTFVLPVAQHQRATSLVPLVDCCCSLLSNTYLEICSSFVSIVLQNT